MANKKSGIWTTVTDQNGVQKFTQFYKGAFYDRDAFVNV